MLNAQIVSPPFPTGMSWLLNCLMELGVRTTMAMGAWIDGPDGSRMLPEHMREHMRWQLPILACGDGRVRFRDDGPIRAVYWGHQLSYALYPFRKTILCVRDLRDTAYSEFCRLVSAGRYRATEAELLAFLTQPEIYMEHFPHLFDLPPADTLAYYYLLCLKLLPAQQLLVVRFEERQADPERELRRVLDFLGIERGEAEITLALAHSELDQVLALQQQRQDARPGKGQTARSGSVGEWKQALSPPALACFRGPAAKALTLLGYEPLADEIAAGPLAALNPERAAQVSALFGQYQQLLSQGQQAQATRLMQGMLRAGSHNLALRTHLGAQLLGLLWMRAIMGVAGSQLPTAARMAQCFFALNAEFSAWPPLARAAAKIANPQHVLHSLGPEPLFRDPAQVPATSNPARLIYFHPELRAAADFGRVARLALDSGLRYFLWKQQGVLLESIGLAQLYELLLQHPYTLAAVPVLQPPARPDFRRSAYELHARLGAAFAPLTLTSLPDCILFATGALAGHLNQPLESWIGGLRVYQALGVLALKQPV